MPGLPQTGDEEQRQTDILLAEYEFARENRNSGDAIGWEMTAISWGGQTLLLGFVLEAIDHPLAELLILAVAILGILLSCFNHIVMRRRMLVCDSMNQVCREVETKLMMRLQPQHRIDSVYPKKWIKKQYTWFLIVNYSFALVWFGVARWAAVSFFGAGGHWMIRTLKPGMLPF